ncbi:MAG: glutaredoxin family protein [Proteobacteria bacterium SW_6_67_9]|nr:MAG: glutaredoxin family protein [Proteobacteria bacterium SW_6_67_9]
MQRRRLTLAAAFVAVVIAPLAQGEVYRWVDDDGTVHFSDEPPLQDGEAERVELPEINTAESVDVDAVGETAAAGGGAGEVIMYSASWCGYCDKARAYFQANDIPFTEYDVEDSRKGRQDYADMDTDSVPVILIDDKRMVGFSAERFDRLYSP